MSLSEILRNVHQLEKSISENQKFITEQKALLKIIKQQLKAANRQVVPSSTSVTPHRPASNITIPSTPAIESSVPALIAAGNPSPVNSPLPLTQNVVNKPMFGIKFIGGNKKENALAETARFVSYMYPKVSRFAPSAAQKPRTVSDVSLTQTTKLTQVPLTQDNGLSLGMSIISPTVRDRVATSTKLKEKLAAIVKENALIPIANPHLASSSASSSTNSSNSAAVVVAPSAPTPTPPITVGNTQPSIASVPSNASKPVASAPAPTGRETPGLTSGAPVVSRGKSTVQSTKTMTTATAAAAGLTDSTMASTTHTTVTATAPSVAANKVPIAAVYDLSSSSTPVNGSGAEATTVPGSATKKQKTSASTSAVTAPVLNKASATGNLASVIPTFRPGNTDEVLKELQKVALPSAKLAAVKQLINQSTVDKLSFNTLLDKGGRALMFTWLNVLEEELVKCKVLRNLGDKEPLKTSQGLTESLVTLLDKGNWTEEWLQEFRFDKILRRIYKVLYEDTNDTMSIKISNQLKTLWTKYRLLYKGLETSENAAAKTVPDIAAFSSVSGAASVTSTTGSAANPSGSSVASVASKAAAVVPSAIAAPAPAPTVSIKKEASSTQQKSSSVTSGSGVGNRAASSSNVPSLVPPGAIARPGITASAVASAPAQTSVAVSSAATIKPSGSNYLNISTNNTKVLPPGRAASPSTPLSIGSVNPTPVALSAAVPGPTSVTASASSSALVARPTVPQTNPVSTAVIPSARGPSMTTVAAHRQTVASQVHQSSSESPLSALNESIPNLSVLLIQLKHINNFPSMYSGAMQLFARMKASPRLCESFLNNGGRAQLINWLTPLSADDFVLPTTIHSSTFCQMIILIVKILDLSFWNAAAIKEFRFDKLLRKLFKKHKALAHEEMNNVITEVWRKFAQRWKEIAPPDEADAGQAVQTVTV